jgi:hypothetical protein
MCLGMPARVTGDDRDGDLIRVDLAGVARLINVGLPMPAPRAATGCWFTWDSRCPP